VDDLTTSPEGKEETKPEEEHVDSPLKDVEDEIKKRVEEEEPVSDAFLKLQNV